MARIRLVLLVLTEVEFSDTCDVVETSSARFRQKSTLYQTSAMVPLSVYQAGFFLPYKKNWMAENMKQKISVATVGISLVGAGQPIWLEKIFFSKDAGWRVRETKGLYEIILQLYI